MGEEPAIAVLVEQAQHRDVAAIRGPAGATVGFEYVGDDDGGRYQCQLSLPGVAGLPTGIRLASLWRAMTALGGERRGVAAALGVLADAVDTANTLLHAFDTYRHTSHNR